jgi:hypothetical protein
VFSPGTPVSSTNKTDRTDIAQILLKVALNTIIHNHTPMQQSSVRTIVNLGRLKNIRKNYC